MQTLFQDYRKMDMDASKKFLQTQQVIPNKVLFFFPSGNHLFILYIVLFIYLFSVGQSQEILAGVHKIYL